MQTHQMLSGLMRHFECNCEEMMDNMVARWRCPVHGERRPNYEAIMARELKEAKETAERVRKCS